MADLLPPNATLLERALAGATARIAGAVIDLEPLIDPAICPPELLPWLAWGESVDIWDPDWSDTTKRAAIADSIPLHRMKGTRAAVELVLARLDALAQIVEWHEASPPEAPHTFEVRVPLDGNSGLRGSADAAAAIIRDVVRVKPLREHLTLVQQLTGAARAGLVAIGRSLLLRRDDARLVDDRSQPWAALLQTENGEPIEAGDGTMLETTP